MGVDSDERDMMTMLMRVAYVDVGGLWERRGGAENDAEVLYLRTGHSYATMPL